MNLLLFFFGAVITEDQRSICSLQVFQAISQRVNAGLLVKLTHNFLFEVSSFRKGFRPSGQVLEMKLPVVPLANFETHIPSYANGIFGDIANLIFLWFSRHPVQDLIGALFRKATPVPFEELHQVPAKVAIFLPGCRTLPIQARQQAVKICPSVIAMLNPRRVFHASIEIPLDF
jgi:hypothetical protein